MEKEIAIAFQRACAIIMFLLTDSVFVDLLRKTGAKTVVWTALYEPWIAERDQKLKSKLESRGIKVKPSNLVVLNL